LEFASRWVPPRVKDDEVDHPSAAGSEDRRHADLKSRMPFRVERDGVRAVLPDRPGGLCRRWSAHEGHSGAGDRPVRVDVP
jgi:hypothetical protein